MRFIFWYKRDSLKLSVKIITYQILLPPAIRFTVSRTCSERIWRIVTPLSRCIGVSVLLLRMHLTKCGLAWTKVLSRLSNLVWKSCVNVDIGSSPFKLRRTIVRNNEKSVCSNNKLLEQNFIFSLFVWIKFTLIVHDIYIFFSIKVSISDKIGVIDHTYRSVWEVGDIRKLTPLGTVSFV